jgi:HAD superfamily hydrolase (TIGR01509 family)
VDGTLAETEQQGHRRAFNRAFAEEGLRWRWDPPTYRRLLAVSGGRERLTAFLSRVEGQPPPTDLVERLVRRKQDHYVDLLRSGGVELRAGVARLIAEVAGRGIRQAIVTTSSRAAVEALVQAALADLRPAFAFWICGEDVRRKKPDPEAYRLACGRLAAAPAGVLAIEDSANGVAAAVGAGLPCLVTLSSLSRHEPPAAFSAAVAVLEGLERQGSAPLVRRGPPCPQGRVTLSWLEHLQAA